jgi:hypothetical protein
MELEDGFPSFVGTSGSANEGVAAFATCPPKPWRRRKATVDETAPSLLGSATAQ